MTYVLIVKIGGVNERVKINTDQDKLLEHVGNWEPGFRLGRISFQDFGHKRGLVSEDGIRVYEIFEVN